LAAVVGKSGAAEAEELASTKGLAAEAQVVEEKAVPKKAPVAAPPN
jgi:hypothetical protein